MYKKPIAQLKKKSVYGLIRIKILYKVWFEGKEWLDV